MSSCTAFAAITGPTTRGAPHRVVRCAAGMPFTGTPVAPRLNAVLAKATRGKVQARGMAMKVFAVKDGAVLDRPLRVAVIGGGPSGACAAETLAKGGCEVFLLERKMDNCKVGVPTGCKSGNT